MIIFIQNQSKQTQPFAPHSQQQNYHGYLYECYYGYGCISDNNKNISSNVDSDSVYPDINPLPFSLFSNT